MIRKSIHSLIADIFNLTAEGVLERSSCGEETLKNTILPTLLRLLTHFIVIILHFIGADDDPDIGKEIKRIIAISTMLALAFSSNLDSYALTSCDLKFHEFLPTRYHGELTFGYQLNECSYPLNQNKDKLPPVSINTTTGDSTYLETLLDQVGLSSKEYHSFCSGGIMNLTCSDNSSRKLLYMDHVKGVGFRSGIDLLRILTMYASLIDQKDRDDRERNISSHCTSIRTIISVVGIESSMNIFREHFFGGSTILPNGLQKTMQSLWYHDKPKD